MDRAITWILAGSQNYDKTTFAIELMPYTLVKIHPLQVIKTGEKL